MKTEKSQIFNDLVNLFSDEKIRACVFDLLSESGFKVELDGNWVSIPRDVFIEILYRYGIQSNGVDPIGDHYRVVLALGGVKDNSFGVISANICFVQLWFDLDLDLVTQDFYLQL